MCKSCIYPRLCNTWVNCANPDCSLVATVKPHFYQPHCCATRKARFPLASGSRRYDQLSTDIAGKSVGTAVKMSGRYAFSKGLKEVRFLFCQTGEHSSATRCVTSRKLKHNFQASRAAPLTTVTYLTGPSSRERIPL
jgi:hypothetical protein